MDINLTPLVINQMTKAQYSQASIPATELCFLTDENISADDVDDTNSTNKFVTASDITSWNGKSTVSGVDDGTNWTSITINGTTKSIPSGGGTSTDVQINGTSIVVNDVANILTETAYNASTNKLATVSDLPDISTKQDTLVSGTNIKTINSTSILGSGDIDTKSQNVTTLSGTSITLNDNSVNTLTPSGNTTFTLPTVTDTTIFHQILVQLNLSTVYTITLGTTTYFGGTAPDLSSAGNYNLIYEYDNSMSAWVVGAVSKA